MKLTIGLYFVIGSIALLGIGFITSVQDGLYFYSVIMLVNLIAWVQALLIEDEEEKSIKKVEKIRDRIS